MNEASVVPRVTFPSRHIPGDSTWDFANQGSSSELQCPEF